MPGMCKVIVDEDRVSVVYASVKGFAEIKGCSYSLIFDDPSLTVLEQISWSIRPKMFKKGES